MPAAISIQSIGQIAIRCHDVQRAVAFYRDVLGMNFLFAPAPNFAFLEVGGTRLMLTEQPEEGFEGTSTLYFKVLNIDQAMDGIRASAEVVSEPHVIADMGSYDLWMSFFKDSEGNNHAFMEERPKQATKPS